MALLTFDQPSLPCRKQRRFTRCVRRLAARTPGDHTGEEGVTDMDSWILIALTSAQLAATLAMLRQKR